MKVDTRGDDTTNLKGKPHYQDDAGVSKDLQDGEYYRNAASDDEVLLFTRCLTYFPVNMLKEKDKYIWVVLYIRKNKDLFYNRRALKVRNIMMLKEGIFLKISDVHVIKKILSDHKQEMKILNNKRLEDMKLQFDMKLCMRE